MRKKLFLLFFVLIFLTTLGFSATITVTNPHSGQIWYKGKTYTITWIKAGSMKGVVKIRLFKKGNKAFKLKIVESTPNNGSFSWVVPKTLVSGIYYIRVKTVDNAVYDDGDFFTIANPLFQKASIKIKNPHPGAIWDKGKTYQIKWIKSGDMNANVKIRLMRNGVRLLKITDFTANSGSFKWTVPTSLANGTYNIRIKTVDNKVFNDSDIFSISGQNNMIVATIDPNSVTKMNEYNRASKDIIKSIIKNNAKAISPNSCKTGNRARDLECLINVYRKSKGLPMIPHSLSLEKVAKAHVKDLFTYHPEKKCGGDGHAWSSHGNWKGGCFEKGDASVMWLKPKEIAGDNNYGYEIYCYGATSPSDALNCWKSSSGHLDVILNRAVWTGFKWTGMAAGSMGFYWVVWFE